SLGLTVLYQGQMIENIRGFVNEDIYLVNPNLVENYTTLAGKQVLQELGQILPDSIDYLFIDPNDLNVFLENVKNIQIKLIVTNYSKEIVSIFNILKEFVTEQHKKFYYQVSDVFRPQNVNHQNLKTNLVFLLK
ncbi:14091_t:CDS:2, partial [Funneliformis geosporum]